MIQQFKAFLALSLLTVSPAALACSFAQIGQSHDYAGAQNFDFPPEVSAGVVINKRNVEKTDGSFEGAPSAKPATWVSKYGSVTFGFGLENPVTGVNEAGLRVYRFLFMEAQYPAANNKPALNESQFVQYLLDTANSVEEVIEKTKAVQIYTARFPTHFAVCDHMARCVMIEAIKGELKIYSGAKVKVDAMTNTDYATSLELMNKCPTADCSLLKDNSDWRFVNAATQVKHFSGSDITGGLFDIMTSVKQTGQQVATLWTLLTRASAVESTFFVKNTKASKTVLTINLKKVDFSCKTPPQVALLRPESSDEIHLSDYSSEFQKTLDAVLTQYLGVSKADAEKRNTYPEKFTHCRE